MISVPLYSETPSGLPQGDVLVLGHSLGTSARLWEEASSVLRSSYRVLTWEIPGHGKAEPAREAYRVEDLTDSLIAWLDAIGVERFHYAGVSLTACVGLDLALRHAPRVATTTIITSGARMDDPAIMRRRAASVRESGIGPFVEPFRARWFAPTTSRATADAMLEVLQATETESYALAAEALADFDVSSRLAEVSVPLLAVAGELDESVPPARSIELAEHVVRGRSVTIPRSAHCLVAEQPVLVADALAGFIEDQRER